MKAICLVIILSCVFYIAVLSERTETVLEYMGTCPGHENLPIVLNTKYRQINSTFIVINVSTQLKEAFDNSYSLKLIVTRIVGGKPISLTVSNGKTKPCALIFSFLGSIFINFMKSAGVSECPLPIGYYHLENELVDMSKIPLWKLQGSYKASFVLTRNKELHACYILQMKRTQKAASK